MDFISCAHKVSRAISCHLIVRTLTQCIYFTNRGDGQFLLLGEVIPTVHSQTGE